MFFFGASNDAPYSLCFGAKHRTLQTRNDGKADFNIIKTKIKSTSAFLGAYPGSSEVDNNIIPDSDTNLNPDTVIYALNTLSASFVVIGPCSLKIEANLSSLAVIGLPLPPHLALIALDIASAKFKPFP